MSGRHVEDYRAECASGAIWVVESGGKAVGFAQGVPGEVKRLFVDAAAVGLGAGAGLMERALADARAGGVDLVRIDATLNAVSFYEKWGFRETGRGVFPGRTAPLPQIDVVLLEKRFEAEPA
ncbi:GNAT family N-acetyltransferase [Roseibium sediminicola]|uniref:GNAT family N-acetyltransferase n=1 Tax=Roseibium sediminicola TaxID=2933272 RepID=A0ABT0GSP0_9HYPH|nr:GNAT family N-acetyltransferase [Roseibium sp. CAU 1639]MCK7612255.1 GNAT family N-acetyltransferase [Roseibium sp. CAU 1639]